ncbi:MAG: hypothetical protein HQ538_02800 [Parcubacteria group bacterium]|nr:hypothetical protein [Parcubacteria group bacterium]
MMEEKKKDKRIYFIIFVVFVLILLGVLYYFVFYSKDEDEVEVDVIEEVAEEVAEDSDEIDMSNWQTYENEEYGFSLKYPEGWEKNEIDDERILFLRNVYKEFSPQIKIEGRFIVDVYKSKDNQTLEKWIDDNKKITEENKLKSKKDTRIGSQNGVERVTTLVLEEIEHKEIFIKNGNYVYSIQPNIIVRFPDIESEQEDKDLAVQGEKEIKSILETVKFN